MGPVVTAPSQRPRKFTPGFPTSDIILIMLSPVLNLTLGAGTPQRAVVFEMTSLTVHDLVVSVGGWPLWALALFGAFFARAVFRRYWTSIRNIPGPFLASFSRLWQVLQILKGHTEVETIKLHKQLGYFVRIGPNEVSVSHPDAVRQLLHAQIAKGPWYAILSLPDYRYVNQMSELDPQQHIRKQRNIASGYALSNIIKHEPHFDTVLRLLTTRLNEFCRSGQPVELDRWFTFFAFDAVGEVIFSKSFGFLEQGKDVRDAIANQRLLAPYAAVMGYYAWFHNLTLGNPLLSRLGIQPSSHVFDTCIAAIDARKENPAKRNDMMQKWLDTRAKYPDRMEEVEIFSTAVGTLGAGGDTVSATIQALFYFLIRHPQYMARVQEELDAAQAREELSPIVQYSEAQKLPFLQACIKETYRLHTAVGLGLPRVAPRGGITIAGRHFAQGTVLSINPWVIHRNPDLFGEDCDSFNPDRWLQKQAGRMDAFLIHWGAGYNACPGRNFAQFEISKLAATLFRDYDIEQVDPNQEWTWHNHFICVPYEWPCRIRQRPRT